MEEIEYMHIKFTRTGKRMKNYFCIAILLVLILSACNLVANPPITQALEQSSPSSTITLTEVTITMPLIEAQATPTIMESLAVTPLQTASQTPSPTVILTPTSPLDLSRYDPDIEPPIIPQHNPPLIAKIDETVELKFDFVCTYMFRLPGMRCDFDVALFTTYGEDDEFVSSPIQKEIHGEVGEWVARPPAVNADGESLRYYLEVSDPQVSVKVRYPTEGTIDLFTVLDLVSIEIPTPNPVGDGELVLTLPWGDGPDEVGTRKRQGYPYREGLCAMDVAEDGRIALLDYVNERVLIFDPVDQSFSDFPIPFTVISRADLQFDQDGQLAIFDMFGESLDQSTIHVPHLYRMAPDGITQAIAPVFISTPFNMTKSLAIFDLYDFRWVQPFNSIGEVNSLEEQRNRLNPWLPFRYVEGLDTSIVRFGDVNEGIAFELRSDDLLGAISYFEKTPQGYVAVFQNLDLIRPVWFDRSGNILKDTTLPNDQYSEVHLDAQMAIGQDGSLYYFNSTISGVDVIYVEGP